LRGVVPDVPFPRLRVPLVVRAICDGWSGVRRRRIELACRFLVVECLSDGGEWSRQRYDRLDAWCCLMRTTPVPILRLRDLDFDLRITLSTDGETPPDLRRCYHQIATAEGVYTWNIGGWLYMMEMIKSIRIAIRQINIVRGLTASGEGTPPFRAR
jgi:hypothetical protein